MMALSWPLSQWYPPDSPTAIAPIPKCAPPWELVWIQETFGEWHLPGPCCSRLALIYRVRQASVYWIGPQCLIVLGCLNRCLHCHDSSFWMLISCRREAAVWRWAQCRIVDRTVCLCLADETESAACGCWSIFPAVATVLSWQTKMRKKRRKKEEEGVSQKDLFLILKLVLHAFHFNGEHDWTASFRYFYSSYFFNTSASILSTGARLPVQISNWAMPCEIKTSMPSTQDHPLRSACNRSLVRRGL